MVAERGGSRLPVDAATEYFQASSLAILLPLYIESAVAFLCPQFLFKVLGIQFEHVVIIVE